MADRYDYESGARTAKLILDGKTLAEYSRALPLTTKARRAELERRIQAKRLRAAELQFEASELERQLLRLEQDEADGQ